MARTTATATAARDGGAGRSGRPPRLHIGRLALLILVLIAASFYVSPLRAFFAQQDRYQREAAALQNARASKTAMERQIELLGTRAYVAQLARAQSSLVPPGTQVFVVKGLPGKAEEDAFGSPAPQVSHSSFSVLDRVEDLWRTLLH